MSAQAASSEVRLDRADGGGTRYDDLILVYGRSFVERLGALKYFMVGCGALGCEFLKNFALNGICCGTEGELIAPCKCSGNLKWQTFLSVREMVA